MDNNYSKFRKAAFGGFNREDVINYIEKMKNEFFDYKKEVEATVAQLNEKIRELETLCETKSDPIAEENTTADNTYETENDAVSDINEATLKLRMVADDLCKSLCDFMERVSENAVSVVIEKQTEEPIVIQSSDEFLTAESAEETINEADETDRVSLILKATESFCVAADEAAEPKEEKTASAPTERNILDILGGASFLK